MTHVLQNMSNSCEQMEQAVMRALQNMSSSCEEPDNVLQAG